MEESSISMQEFKKNYLNGFYNSYINEIDNYVIMDGCCFDKRRINNTLNYLKQLDTKNIVDKIKKYNQTSAEKGYNFIKENGYIGYLEKIEEEYTKSLEDKTIIQNYNENDISPLNYHVNIFASNMKSSMEDKCRQEVLYTKLLSYCFNLEEIGCHLYKSILKIAKKDYEGNEEIKSFAEKVIKVIDGNKRIDVFIKAGKNSCIIEAKIDSQEHGDQLQVYENYASKKNINNLIYLTIKEVEMKDKKKWVNITWLQVASALYDGLIISGKENTPAGIYVQFFISNILYHLYDVDYKKVKKVKEALLPERVNTYKNIIKFIEY